MARRKTTPRFPRRPTSSSRRLHGTEHTSTIFASQCAYGLLLCGVAACLRPAALSPLGWVLLLAVGLAAGLGQLTMTRAFRDLPAGEGSLRQMLVPVGVALGGRLFFAEKFSAAELVGAALILASTVVTAIRR